MKYPGSRPAIVGKLMISVLYILYLLKAYSPNSYLQSAIFYCQYLYRRW